MSSVSITKSRQIEDHVNPNGIHGYVTVQVYRHLEDRWETIDEYHPNLLTTDGRDFYHQQVLINTAAGTRGSNAIAVTTDTGAPAAGDTALATEITTGGLARVQATTISHGDNTNSSTIEHEWTASATHTAVQKCALFNATTAPVSGILTHEGIFTPASLIANDKLKVTYVINIG